MPASGEMVTEGGPSPALDRCRQEALPLPPLPPPPSGPAKVSSSVPPKHPHRVQPQPSSSSFVLIMRARCNNFIKLGGFIFASVCAWCLGSLLAYMIPEDSLISTYDDLQNLVKKPKLVAPLPKRQKCDHWSPCLSGSYAYRILSGGGKAKFAKICFEDELLISEKKGNVGRGINIAVVDYNTGKVIATKYFDMWEGEFSKPMTDFIRNAPLRSLLLMVTHDDGSKRLMEDGKRAIAELGSKEIRNLKFRSSWVFIAGKGFKLPENIEKEKINHSDKNKNRYSDWPAEIQIEGCIPKNLTS